MKKVPGLHREAVMGVIQVIKFLDKLMEEKKGTNLGELCKVGFKGRREDAHNFILEFIKDGVPNLIKEQIKKVAAGSYEDIWASTNKYLEGFGYKPEKPEPIDM